MAETLNQIVQDAIFDLRSRAEDNPDEWDADRYIADTADCATPVYDADLVELALENVELRPAHWVAPIADAVYAHVRDQLESEWAAICEEREETEELAMDEGGD